MSRLTEVEKQRFRNLEYETEVKNCLEFTNGNLEAILVCEGMDYDSFVYEGYELADKLKSGCELFELNHSIMEKVDKIAWLGQIANRYSKQEQKKWTDIRKIIRGEQID